MRHDGFITDNLDFSEDLLMLIFGAKLPDPETAKTDHSPRRENTSSSTINVQSVDPKHSSVAPIVRTPFLCYFLGVQCFLRSCFIYLFVYRDCDQFTTSVVDGRLICLTSIIE
jgi:hypothetical protein